MVSTQKKSFTTLAEIALNEQKSVVISRYGDSAYTVAAKLVVDDNGVKHPFFLKGSLQLDGMGSMYALRDALNEVISAEEKHAFENNEQG